MLSFLRESLDDLPAQQKADAATEKPTGNGTDKSQEPEYLTTVAAHRKRVRKSTTVLAVLFVIGLLCLWFMIKKSTPKTASASGNAEDAKVEIAIARLTGAKSKMFGKMDEIVGKFHEFTDVPQVKVNELAKNPFELETLLTNLNEKSDAGHKKIDANMLGYQQARQKSKGMRLWSIMQSDNGNLCMIDDEILRLGDSIKGFEVRQIGDNFVKLESDGVEIMMKLSE